MDTQIVPTALCTTGKIADLYSIRRATVLAAVRNGRIPALSVEANNGRPMFLINPVDADRLWATRRKEKAAA